MEELKTLIDFVQGIGSRQHFFNRPTFLQSPINKFSTYSHLFLPVSNTHFFTHPFNFYGVTSVPQLLANGRPAAVFTAVISVIINTIKGFSLRSFTHIFKEYFKFVPFFSYFYSPASVVKIVFMSLSVTARSHLLPTTVGFRNSFRFLSMSMSGARNNFSLKTSARLTLPHSQRVAGNCSHRTTSTTTHPESSSSNSNMRITQYNPSSVRTTYHTNYSST